MEKQTYHEFVFDNVSKAGADKLRAFLTGEPTGNCSDENIGYAETSCFSAKFAYNPKTGRLTVEPVHLVAGLRGPRFKRMILDRIRPNDTTKLTATTDPSPMPGPPCACYNWVFGYLHNETDQTLTYSTIAAPSHGNIIYAQTKIPAGQTPAEQGNNGAFQNQSPKDSGNGCFGTVTWDIDGASTLVLNYGVNTLTTTSATVSITGANAKYYNASVDKRTGFCCACAFLYPTVTLFNAN